MKIIDTDAYSTRLRVRAVIPEKRQILIARLSGSTQEQDLSEPLNCAGYGRIRHFRVHRYDDWSENPLPVVPAAKALGYDPEGTLRAQVFQNAACNWRCWYCYVDFNRLAADRRVAEYFTADQLIDSYLADAWHPLVIDLSGGQPDLVPEWVLWTMETLQARGVAKEVFLWSDDNLSNDFFWRFLGEDDRHFIASYPNYARVACFKGYDAESFTFNTRAAPDLFHRQFEIFGKLLAEGLDMYAYVTFTSSPSVDLQEHMRSFVDQLQRVHPNLPLRTVPLKIEVFSPTASRVGPEHLSALAFQCDVHAVWLEELEKRFSAADRQRSICDVPLG